jgi:hypothetical protein
MPLKELLTCVLAVIKGPPSCVCILLIQAVCKKISTNIILHFKSSWFNVAWLGTATGKLSALGSSSVLLTAHSQQSQANTGPKQQ